LELHARAMTHRRRGRALEATSQRRDWPAHASAACFSSIRVVQIPIVKLNPFKILDLKRGGEEAVRATGVRQLILEVDL
jgi:hypothetical protein